MKEIQKIIYVADDGKEFCTEKACREYEEDIKEYKKITQKYNDIIDFCSAYYDECDDGNYIWCNNNQCPFHNTSDSHYCRFDCIPCIDMPKIKAE